MAATRAARAKRRRQGDADDDDDDDDGYIGAGFIASEPPKSKHWHANVLSMFSTDLKTWTLRHAELLRSLRKARSAATKLKQLLAENKTPRSLQVTVNLELPAAVYTEDVKTAHADVCKTATDALTRIVVQARVKHADLLHEQLKAITTDFTEAVHQRLVAVHHDLVSFDRTTVSPATLQQVEAMLVQEFKHKITLQSLQAGLRHANAVDKEQRQQERRHAAAQAAATADASMTVAETVERAVEARLASLLPKSGGARASGRSRRTGRAPRPSPGSGKARRPNAKSKAKAKPAGRQRPRHSSTAPSRGRRSSRPRQRRSTGSTPRPSRGGGPSTGPSPEATRRRSASRQRGRADNAKKWR